MKQLLIAISFMKALAQNAAHTGINASRELFKHLTAHLSGFEALHPACAFLYSIAGIFVAGLFIISVITVIKIIEGEEQ